jgi:hypothetical protein
MAPSFRHIRWIINDSYSTICLLPAGHYCSANMSTSPSFAARSHRCTPGVARSTDRSRSTISALLAALMLACAGGVLASCSSVLSELPSQAGGLPEGTPERPATAPAYPAVHDMPPPRNSGAVLTEEEKKKVEAELEAIRAEQARRAAERANIN